MPRVNLLPWRDEIRHDRERRFYISLAITAATMMAIIGVIQLLINGVISDQQERNDLISAEIKVLNKQIKEIDELQAQKDALLARMNIIQSLQGTRPLVVHLFDDLVRAIPDGVYTSSVIQKKHNLEIKGHAQSNARVSAFMRNIDKSEWLTEPTLSVIRTAESNRGKTSQFTLNAKQVSIATEEDEDQQPKKGKKRKKR